MLAPAHPSPSRSQWVAGAPLVNGALPAELLVVAATEAACALMDHCLPDLKVSRGLCSHGANACDRDSGAQCKASSAGGSAASSAAP